MVADCCDYNSFNIICMLESIYRKLIMAVSLNNENNGIQINEYATK